MTSLDDAIAAIDDYADPLHGDMTPSVFALADIGLPAVPRILDLMLDAPAATRRRAQRALERIVMRRDHGYVEGRGFPTPADDTAFLAAWAAHGAYDADASEDARHNAVNLWRAWLREKGGIP
jgi:hypothetical protein